MFSRKTYGDLQVNINGYLISGVQSFNGSYELPNDNVLSYGGGIARATNETVIGNISFQKLVVGEDNLFSLISGVLTGHLFYQTGYFGFNKGYINSYRVAAQVNDVPTIDVDFTAFGNVGSGVSTPTQQSPVNWFQQNVTHGGISLAIDGQEATNRVTDFNYTVTVPRLPRYLLGEKSPSYVLVNWPITIDTTFTIELDDYQFQEISGAVCGPRQKDLVLTLGACGGTGVVGQFKAPRSRLLGEAIRASIGPNVQVTATYRTFLNQFSELL